MLTAMHDIYVTLTQLACRHQVDGEADYSRMRQHGAPGLNLFVDAITEARTCTDAGIPPEYCPHMSDELNSVQLPGHRDEVSAKVLAAWSDYLESSSLAHTRARDFYKVCRSLAPEQFVLVRAAYTSREEGRLEVLIGHQGDLQTGFFLDVAVSQHDGAVWRVLEFRRSASMLQETCHVNLTETARPLCFCIMQ